MTRLLAGLFGLSVLALVGCAEDGPKVSPVSGRVTLDGKPLGGATVTFQPNGSSKLNAGPGSSAVTGEDGTYLLQLDGKKKPGAVVGSHQVYISKPAKQVAADSDDISPDLVPAKYNKNTALKFDVPADGTKAANFDLLSK